MDLDHWIKIKESKKRDKFQDLARELKKTMEHDTNSNWCAQNNPQRFGKGTGRLRNQRISGDHPDSGFIKISLNTEMIPGDSRRLAVPQTPVKNRQLMLMGKTLKRVK